MNITIIGSGNVGSALALSLSKSGHRIMEIGGRNKKTVAALAKKVKASTVTDLKKISPVDLIIICVNDQQLVDVAATIPFTTIPVVHTSGATSINVLKRFKICGVLYPVNTITKDHTSFAGTPFCIDSNSTKLTSSLKLVVKDLQGKASIITDRQRFIIHLAAVFANNFSNALFQSAYDLLKKEKLSFSLLQPLIETTVANIKTNNPVTVQTGPALRGDTVTMKKHLQLLEKDAELKKVYQLLSALILKQGKLVK